MTEPASQLRLPSTIGYLPWILHRLTALALIGLLALHVGVQLYPSYGFDIVYTWGIYGGLLDVTLGLVLLHGFLGVRSTVLESCFDAPVKRLLVWAIGVVALAIFLLRLLG